MRKKVIRTALFLGLFFSFSFGLAFNSSFYKTAEADGEETLFDGFELHQLSLGANGDCALINYGNCNILIDAGGTEKSSSRIKANLDKYVKDNVIDYVIFTHADGDHIINVNSALGGWLFDNNSRQIGMLVDFDITKDPTNNHPLKSKLFSSNEYSSYNSFKNIFKTRIRHYLPASILVHKARGVKLESDYVKDSNLSLSSIGDEYELDLKPKYADEPKDDNYTLGNSGASIKFLYNYFYDHPIKGKASSSKINEVDRNVISVCTMLKLKSSSGYKRLLFNGDLEEYRYYFHNSDDAESDELPYSRITSNDSNYGPEMMLFYYNQTEFNEPVTYYKASHHGSLTSNDPCFLEKIRPQYIGITAVAGGQYDFVKDQGMITMSKYTDHIFITDMKNEDNDTVPYYGNIVMKISNDNVVTSFENPDTFETMVKPDSIFLDDGWIKNKVLFEFNVINLTAGGKNSINLNYIKLGHIDIVIGAGNSNGEYVSNGNKKVLKSKLSHLCNDGVLEYFIIPSFEKESTGLIDIVYGASGIEKVNNVIYFAKSGDTSLEGLEKQLKDTKKVNKNNIKDFSSYESPIYLFPNSTSFYLSFYGNYSSTLNSFYTLFNAYDYRYLNVGEDFYYQYKGSDIDKLSSSINTIQMSSKSFIDYDKDKDGSIGNFFSFYDKYHKKYNSNVMLNRTIYFNSADDALNNNIKTIYLEKLFNYSLCVTKYINRDGLLIDESGRAINGDTITRCLIKNQKLSYLRKSATHNLSEFSICDSSSRLLSYVTTKCSLSEFSESIFNQLKA